MSQVRPDQLSGVETLPDSSIIIAELNPDNDSTRKVVKITKSGLFNDFTAGAHTSASNIGSGSGLISGEVNDDIKIKSLVAGDNIFISGDEQELIISSSGGGSSSSNTPFLFFSNLVNNDGIADKTYYQTPTSDTYLSGATVDSASDLTVYLRWDGPDDSYMGSASINGQSIPTGNITELGSYTRRFEGYLSGLNLVGATGITGTANSRTSTISLSELGAGPTPISVTIDSISNATAKAGTNLGTTDLKGDDSINIFATFTTSDVTGIKVHDSGISDGISYTNYSLTDTGDGNHTATIPITVTDGRNGAQSVSVVAKNDFGTAGNDTASSNTVSLDQTYPSISASDPTSYNGRSDGLREGESTTFANTISNWSDGVDYISYEALSSDITITSSGTFQNPKTVGYVQGIFSDTDNLRISVSRTGNGANDSQDITVKIANGPVITGITLNSTAASATSPNIVGSSEIKGGDIVNAEVYVDGNGVSVGNIDLSISNAGVSDGSQTSYTSYSNTTLGDGSFKYTVPINVTSSTARDGAQAVTMTARNNFGTESDEASSSASATVNNSVYPVISISTISYPAGQEALKDAEFATVSNSVTNFDSLVYSSSNGNLTIMNDTTFEASKSVSRIGGGYNISSNNFTITATKDSNGRVVSDSDVVKIADTALSFSVSNLASTLSSSPAGTSDNFDLNADQQFLEIPSLNTDASQTSPSTLIATASGTSPSSNDYRITVSDTDTKGTFTWVVSGQNLAGKVTSSISTNPNYTLAGFSSRTITASPVSLGAGLADIGTTVSDTNDISFENISEGGAGPGGGTIYTYQSYANGISLDNTYDEDNKFTVCDSAGVTNTTGDHVFNLDKLNRAANTSVSNPAQFSISES